MGIAEQWISPFQPRLAPKNGQRWVWNWIQLKDLGKLGKAKSLFEDRQSQPLLQGIASDQVNPVGIDQGNDSPERRGLLQAGEKSEPIFAKSPQRAPLSWGILLQKWWSLLTDFCNNMKRPRRYVALPCMAGSSIDGMTKVHFQGRWWWKTPLLQASEVSPRSLHPFAKVSY